MNTVKLSLQAARPTRILKQESGKGVFADVWAVHRVSGSDKSHFFVAVKCTGELVKVAETFIDGTSFTVSGSLDIQYNSATRSRTTIINAKTLTQVIQPTFKKPIK